MDDEALVEEIDRPERRLVHARNAREREQKGEDAGNRQRADREPRPVAQLAPDRACGEPFVAEFASANGSHNDPADRTDLAEKGAILPPSRGKVSLRSNDG